MNPLHLLSAVAVFAMADASGAVTREFMESFCENDQDYDGLFLYNDWIGASFRYPIFNKTAPCVLQNAVISGENLIYQALVDDDWGNTGETYRLEENRFYRGVSGKFKDARLFFFPVTDNNDNIFNDLLFGLECTKDGKKHFWVYWKGRGYLDKQNQMLAKAGFPGLDLRQCSR